MDLITRKGIVWKVVAIALFCGVASAASLVFKITSAPVGTTAPACGGNCKITVNVILLNNDPDFVCQTFIDFETYRPKGGGQRVTWVIQDGLQKGDKSKYLFEADGVAPLPLPSTGSDDFDDRKTSGDGRSHSWRLKPSSTKTEMHYEFHVVQTRNGQQTGKCKPQDPIIANDS